MFEVFEGCALNINKSHVPDIPSLIFRATFRRFPAVREVKVFGSRATDTARRASDLDLAISAPDASPAEWADICDAVENAPLIYELDVMRPERTVNPRLKEKIAREGVVIYPE